jgi:hypothetical protein
MGCGSSFISRTRLWLTNDIANVKNRFPTYFEYHELAQEIPSITAQMEIDAQRLGAWKAKTLSGSEDGSPGSFLNNRHRSKSIETSASWDVPDPEVSHSLLQYVCL